MVFRASLITTVLNEENNIGAFLDSVISQSLRPNEFIIVDGGSKDKTCSIIRKYSKKYKWIKLFIVKKATRGKGRNYAIKKSRNQLIAVTDAGCILDKNWLRNITKPFSKKSVKVVSGSTKPIATNNFEYCQALVVHRDANKISRFSSRSLAFRKNVWEDVGGYPEFDYTGEDTLFNFKIKEESNIDVASNALVNWRMRPNLISFIKQFYNYGVGDKISRNIFRLKLNLGMVILFYIYLIVFLVSLFFSLCLSLILVLIPILVLILYGLFKLKHSKRKICLFYCPLLYFLMRISYILGVSFGR